MKPIHVRFTDEKQTAIYGVLSFVDFPKPPDQGIVFADDPRYAEFFMSQTAELKAMLPKPV